MRRPTEKISTLQWRTPFQIDPKNVPKALVIPTVPKCLAKPETVNLASEVLGGGQNKTQNLRQMTLNLAEGAVRVRSLERVTRAVKRLPRSDLERARGWTQGLAGEIRSFFSDISRCSYWVFYWVTPTNIPCLTCVSSTFNIPVRPSDVPSPSFEETSASWDGCTA